MSYQWMAQILQQQKQQRGQQEDFDGYEGYDQEGYEEELENEAGGLGYEDYGGFSSANEYEFYDEPVMAKAARITRAQARAQAAAAAAAAASAAAAAAATTTGGDDEESSSHGSDGSDGSVYQAPNTSSPNTDPDPATGQNRPEPTEPTATVNRPRTPDRTGTTSHPQTPYSTGNKPIRTRTPPSTGKKTPAKPSPGPRTVASSSTTTATNKNKNKQTGKEKTPNKGKHLPTPRKTPARPSVPGSNLTPAPAAVDVPDAPPPTTTTTTTINPNAHKALPGGGRPKDVHPTAASDLYWTGYVNYSSRHAATDPDGLVPPQDLLEMDTSSGEESADSVASDDSVKRAGERAKEGVKKAIRESELPPIQYDRLGGILADQPDREKQRRKLGVREVFNDRGEFYKAVGRLLAMGVLGQREVEAVVRGWRAGLKEVDKDREERVEWRREREQMKKVEWEGLGGREYGAMKKKEWRLKGQRKGVSRCFVDKGVFGLLGSQVETAHLWWGRFGKVPGRLVREFRATGAGCRLQGLVWEERLSVTDFEIFLRRWLEWRYGRFMEDRGATRRKRRLREKVERKDKKRMKVEGKGKGPAGGGGVSFP
ncbi:hypothetical protein QBC41DRAFT_359219 [Cercophora samala]|uniref:Uncharacterized protein n=1 Tax=Cercophora samala TaxID=330535 RepID=A0AA40D8I3_9PEZI|nr:hypothetical protein QBC41DRAFT_359219 [Cercophora samala]